MFYWNKKGGFIYSGEMIEGDREATPEEILHRSRAEWRNRANSDFSERKELYLKNIAYAEAMGRDSEALKSSLLVEETTFKERILLINQGINPYEAVE